jgi:c(7)-type cytochrome triheme protein
MIRTTVTGIICWLIASPAFGIDTIDMVLDSKVASMKKAGLGPVVYPHKLHEQIYKCEDCHPSIFIDKRGANDIDMQKNITDQACGASGCHNSAYAFPLYFCDKCHTPLEPTEDK